MVSWFWESSQGKCRSACAATTSAALTIILTFTNPAEFRYVCWPEPALGQHLCMDLFLQHLLVTFPWSLMIHLRKVLLQQTVQLAQVNVTVVHSIFSVELGPSTPSSLC
uniref:(northern house mosquito) hypothetical protein n=1 Tax=Culex pipiens TaxID=7175 RepID=A0A8D8J2V2_CULPI